MNQQNKKIIFFDFDGVLVNTLELSYKIHLQKNKDFTWERFQSFANGNILDGFSKAVKEEHFVATDDFYDQYEKELIELSVLDILRKLIEQVSATYILIIISSTRDRAIKDFLQKENLTSFFTDVLGQDFNKSKVFKIHAMLEKYEVEPSHSLLITDTLGDIREANECTVPSIGVTWGLHDRQILEKGNPVSIVEHPIDLFGAIEDVLK